MEIVNSKLPVVAAIAHVKKKHRDTEGTPRLEAILQSRLRIVNVKPRHKLSDCLPQWCLGMTTVNGQSTAEVGSSRIRARILYLALYLTSARHRKNDVCTMQWDIIFPGRIWQMTYTRLWKIAANAPMVDLKWSINVAFKSSRNLDHSCLWSSTYYEHFQKQSPVTKIWLLWPTVIQNAMGQFPPGKLHQISRS